MARHNDTGNWGEDLVCDYLVAKGCAIVERNWKSGNFELDVVAIEGNCVAFVEVKTRSDRDSDPFQAINRAKIGRLSRAAHAYIMSHDIKLDVRFDVAGVCGTPDDYSLEYIADAFLPPLNTYR